MNDTIKDILIVCSSIISASAALFAIYNFRYVARKNIRIVKAEKILIIILGFARYYFYQYRAYKALEYYHDSNGQKLNELKAFEKLRDEFLNFKSWNDLMCDLFELESLSKTYLKGDTKMQLLAFYRYFMDFSQTSIKQQWILRWDDGFLTPEEFYQYVDHIEEIIIDSIGMTSKQKK